MRALTDVVCPQADQAAPYYETVARLVRAIDACVNVNGSRTFSVADLFRHARDPFQHRLSDAIAAAIGDDGKGPALGNVLRSALLKRYDGLAVIQHGTDSAGAIWEVRKWAGDDGDFVPASPPGA